VRPELPLQRVGIHAPRLGLHRLQNVQPDLDQIRQDVHNTPTAVAEADLAGGVHAGVQAREVGLDVPAPSLRAEQDAALVPPIVAEHDAVDGQRQQAFDDRQLVLRHGCHQGLVESRIPGGVHQRLVKPAERPGALKDAEPEPGDREGVRVRSEAFARSRVPAGAEALVNVREVVAGQARFLERRLDEMERPPVDAPARTVQVRHHRAPGRAIVLHAQARLHHVHDGVLQEAPPRGGPVPRVQRRGHRVLDPQDVRHGRGLAMGDLAPHPLPWRQHGFRHRPSSGAGGAPKDGNLAAGASEVPVACQRLPV